MNKVIFFCFLIIPGISALICYSKKDKICEAGDGLCYTDRDINNDDKIINYDCFIVDDVPLFKSCEANVPNLARRTCCKENYCNKYLIEGNSNSSKLNEKEWTMILGVLSIPLIIIFYLIILSMPNDILSLRPE